MYAVRRIFIALVMLVLLMFAITAIEVSVTAHSPALHEAGLAFRMVAFLASVIFVIVYLVRPLFRRVRVDGSPERPWRLVSVIGVAVIILVLSTMILQVLDLPSITAENGTDRSNQIVMHNIVRTLLSLVAALFYLLYPIPKSLRRT